MHTHGMQESKIIPEKVITFKLVLYLGKNRNVRVEAYIHGYEYCLFICSEQYIYSWAAIYTVYLYSIFSMAIYRTGFAVLEPN